MVLSPPLFYLSNEKENGGHGLFICSEICYNQSNKSRFAAVKRNENRRYLAGGVLVCQILPGDPAQERELLCSMAQGDLYQIRII